jgi:predicted HicB family RNase H-like nuclease
MADRGEEAWVQLATRIPKALHRQLKLHCVRADTSLMDFVVVALREKLTKESSRRRTSRSGT